MLCIVIVSLSVFSNKILSRIHRTRWKQFYKSNVITARCEPASSATLVNFGVRRWQCFITVRRKRTFTKPRNTNCCSYNKGNHGNARLTHCILRGIFVRQRRVFGDNSVIIFLISPKKSRVSDASTGEILLPGTIAAQSEVHLTRSVGCKFKS